ncbi:MAG: hypothetical protein IPG72_15710 [Ardenticatenales bacterium]|jgi:thioredoxin-like negative regulator of GroEL|nr:hypothetical protein [Ardenticatenales bacterium]
MKPVVHGLEDRYAGRIDFVYLDIDDDATAPLKEQLGFRGQPQFFLVDADGNTVQSWRGRTKEAEFVEAFDGLVVE